MTEWLQDRLREFVDRSAEMEAYAALLDGSTGKRVAVVWGEGNCGKSSLLQRMIDEAKQRSLRYVHVDWKRKYDYLAFMRAVRDQLGSEQFQPFNDLVNFFTKPDYRVSLDVKPSASISVLEGATLEGSPIERVAGVLIEDLNVVMPRADLGIEDGDRVVRLTQAFLSDLGKLAVEQSLLFFVDTVEDASANTAGWLWDELLDSVRRGTAGDVRFVVCGRTPPPEANSWPRDLLELALPPLKLEDVREYLSRRGVDDPKEREALADFLFSTTKGKAGLVASNVDLFVNFREAKVRRG